MKAKTLSALSAFLWAAVWLIALLAKPRTFPVYIAGGGGTAAAALALAAVFVALGVLALRRSRPAFLTLFLAYAAAALYGAFLAVRVVIMSGGNAAVLGSRFVSMALAVVVVGAFFAAVNYQALKGKG